MDKTRLYELYPKGSGLSVMSRDYHGEIYGVAAVSVKQAYYFAGNKIWAKDPDRPAGIVYFVSKYKEPEGLLWNGDRTWNWGPRHDASGAEISKAMHEQMEMADG